MYFVKQIERLEWDHYFCQCHKTNILQSWQYGSSKEQTSKWSVFRFLVVNDKGEPVALAQFLALGIPFLGGIARMNRGPILIGDVKEGQTEVILSEVILVLMKQCRKKLWWVIQLAPEMLSLNIGGQHLTKMGLRKLPVPSAGSGLLSLTIDEDQMMKGLNGKWRNCLRKGLRGNLSIKISHGKCDELNVLLTRYSQLQEANDFSGIPVGLISSLANQVGPDWEFTLLWATEEEDADASVCLGMVVIIRHGDTSTYLIGTTDKKGRALNVNYVLLWNAILYAKKSGSQWFDIGGLNESTPKGIAHFKRGLNSELYTLIGEWRRVIFPWQLI